MVTTGRLTLETNPATPPNLLRQFRDGNHWRKLHKQPMLTLCVNSLSDFIRACKTDGPPEPWTRWKSACATGGRNWEDRGQEGGSHVASTAELLLLPVSLLLMPFTAPGSFRSSSDPLACVNGCPVTSGTDNHWPVWQNTSSIASFRIGIRDI